MIDEPDDIMDYNVARHIVRVHQHQEEALSPEFATVQLQRYIAYARSLKPQVFSSIFKPVVLLCQVANLKARTRDTPYLLANLTKRCQYGAVIS